MRGRGIHATNIPTNSLPPPPSLQDRQFGDFRQQECFDQRYSPLQHMPKTTVIIIFHNEAMSTLLRTVVSVLKRSPPELLQEVRISAPDDDVGLTPPPPYPVLPKVLLVDDASTGDWLGPQLDAEVAKLQKTRLLRLPSRSGLIRAKVAGAHAAKGEVLTFLDRCGAGGGRGGGVGAGWLATP